MLIWFTSLSLRVPSKENHYLMVTNTRIYDFLTYFAYKTKSCQNQNLCFKSFDSHSYKVYRKVLQSILASSTTNWGTLVQISWCWVIFRYSFLSMKQLRIILHTLLLYYRRYSTVSFCVTTRSFHVWTTPCINYRPDHLLRWAAKFDFML